MTGVDLREIPPQGFRRLVDDCRTIQHIIMNINAVLDHLAFLVTRMSDLEERVKKLERKEAAA